MTDDGFVDFDCLYAAEREPLLRDHPKNARRRAALDHIRDLLKSKEGEGHAGLLEFVECMEPDSALGAWERLYHRTKEVDPSIASLVALEYRAARSAVWRAMKTGADVIPHLTPICAGFDDKRREALGNMRSELLGALGSLNKSVSLDGKMRDYVANLARFGSRADDEMTLLIVDELYIRRGLLEEACKICEKILEFKGFDRDRMAASTLVEDIMVRVLAGLEDRSRHNRKVAETCGSILRSRSSGLGLGIRPDSGDHNALRALSEFAFDIAARRRILPAEDIGLHIRKRYPKSHEFLELSNASNLQKMVERGFPLAANLSVSMDSQRLAADRGVPYKPLNALTILEPMLGALYGIEASLPPLKKWRAGMRGEQLWEHLFEMEMYLRLRLASPDAAVSLDKKACGREVDLEVNGCYAEVYSPREGEILVDGHFVTIEDSGRDFFRQVLSKRQLASVGERETVMIVECPPGTYMSVTSPGKKALELLKKARQPGAVLFVRKDRSAQRAYTFLPNPNAVTPVSEPTIKILEGALELEFPPGGSQERR
ncbi:MAG: hypothetical protein OXU25_01965 [Thaumarchaeota archaeon]|nr:hypothetical protein [Nitrososphaerota archaeon]